MSTLYYSDRIGNLKIYQFYIGLIVTIIFINIVFAIIIYLLGVFKIKGALAEIVMQLRNIANINNAQNPSQYVTPILSEASAGKFI